MITGVERVHDNRNEAVPLVYYYSHGSFRMPAMLTNASHAMLTIASYAMAGILHSRHSSYAIAGILHSRLSDCQLCRRMLTSADVSFRMPAPVKAAIC